MYSVYNDRYASPDRGLYEKPKRGYDNYGYGSKPRQYDRYEPVRQRSFDYPTRTSLSRPLGPTRYGSSHAAIPPPIRAPTYGTNNAYHRGSPAVFGKLEFKIIAITVGVFLALACVGLVIWIAIPEEKQPAAFVKATLTFNGVVFEASMGTKGSVAFNDLEKSICNGLKAADPTVVTCELLSVTNGSIVCETLVGFDSSGSPAKVKASAETANYRGQYIDGKTPTVKTATVDKSGGDVEPAAFVQTSLSFPIVFEESMSVAGSPAFTNLETSVCDGLRTADPTVVACELLSVSPGSVVCETLVGVDSSGSPEKLKASAETATFEGELAGVTPVVETAVATVEKSDCSTEPCKNGAPCAASSSALGYTCDCAAANATIPPTCTGCLKGFYLSSSMCVQCAADTYKDTEGTEACTPCPTGSTNGLTAQISNTACVTDPTTISPSATTEETNNNNDNSVSPSGGGGDDDDSNSAENNVQPSNTASGDNSDDGASNTGSDGGASNNGSDDGVSNTGSDDGASNTGSNGGGGNTASGSDSNVQASNTGSDDGASNTDSDATVTPSNTASDASSGSDSNNTASDANSGSNSNNTASDANSGSESTVAPSNTASDASSGSDSNNTASDANSGSDSTVAPSNTASDDNSGSNSSVAPINTASDASSGSDSNNTASDANSGSDSNNTASDANSGSESTVAPSNTASDASSGSDSSVAPSNTDAATSSDNASSSEDVSSTSA